MIDRGRGPIRIGVVDSGWTRGSQDERVHRGIGFASRTKRYDIAVDSDDDDLVGHGTICTRVILALAPNVQVIPLRVFDRSLETSTRILCAALEWAVSARFDLLNLSLSTTTDGARDPLYRLCERLDQQGTIIVAAARNKYHDGYPATFDNVLGVSTESAARQGQLAFEPTGSTDYAISRATPNPAASGRGNASISDSSLAAAYVAGLAASTLETRGRMSRFALRALLDGQLGVTRCSVDTDPAELRHP